VCACRERAAWGRRDTDLRHGQPHHTAATHRMAPANERRVATPGESCTSSRIAVCAQPSGRPPPAGGERAPAPRVHERRLHCPAAPADVATRPWAESASQPYAGHQEGPDACCNGDRRVERCFKRDDAPRNPTTTRPVPTPTLSHRRIPHQCLCATRSDSCHRTAKSRATKATMRQNDRHSGVSRRDLGTQGETSGRKYRQVSEFLTTY
jgi:hypothetical protein